MKMVSLGFLLVTVAATVSASMETQVHSPKAKALSAPTYYLAVSARGCTSDVIQFDGVFNLPTGSLVRISINDFNDDAWTQFSNAMTVRKNSEGQFDGDIHPKDGVKFHRNLILLSRFTPHEPVQPTSVVQIVGMQGEALTQH